MRKITRFIGDHLFLSNFYFVEIEYKGDKYPSLEHAYQAAKFKSRRRREEIRRLSYPGQTKQYARKYKDEWREDWFEVNLEIMESLLRQKFGKAHITCLWRRLVNTGDVKLIEGNTWGDGFWGMIRSDGKLRGKNHLGKLLMKIRDELA